MGNQSPRSKQTAHFSRESFGPTNGLKEGIYVAKALMPISRVQPDRVRRVIGQNGEKLTGPLVKDGQLGVTVSADKEFTIGGADIAGSRKTSHRASQ